MGSYDQRDARQPDDQPDALAAIYLLAAVDQWGEQRDEHWRHRCQHARKTGRHRQLAECGSTLWQQ